jgi:hypothetical protein
MNPRFALAWFALGILSSGCALWHDGTRNLVLSIKAPLEAHHEKARNRQWAEDAWLTVAKGTYSKDYADGFKDGFADYLFYGGDGELPLTPPLHYRSVRYQNPQGYAAIQDWHHGYRHGAGVARDSGAREWITGPSPLTSLSGAAPPKPAPAVAAPLIELPPPEPVPVPPAVQPKSEQASDKAPINARIADVFVAPPTGTRLEVPAEPLPESQPTPDTTKARITGVREAPMRARITRTAVTPN